MVYIRRIELPQTVHGAISPHSDGDYSVYINARLPLSEQRQVWQHEKTHIKGEHSFDDMTSLLELEGQDNTSEGQLLPDGSGMEDCTVLFLRHQGERPSHEQLSQIVKLLDTLPSEEDALPVT